MGFANRDGRAWAYVLGAIIVVAAIRDVVAELRSFAAPAGRQVGRARKLAPANPAYTIAVLARMLSRLGERELGR